MYTRIIIPTIDIYDANTGQFEVTLAVELPHSQEQKLLNLLNRGELFSDLFILNADVANARPGYVPPTIDHPERRVGVLRLLARDDTGLDVPLEIHLMLTAQARGIYPDDPYRLSSIQYSDIEVESINRLA